MKGACDSNIWRDNTWKKKNVDVESNWKATLYCVESAIACFIKDKCNCEGYVVPFDKKKYQ